MKFPCSLGDRPGLAHLPVAIDAPADSAAADPVPAADLAPADALANQPPTCRSCPCGSRCPKAARSIAPSVPPPQGLELPTGDEIVPPAIGSREPKS